MADNAQKTPVAAGLQLWSIQQAAMSEELTGRNWPCSVVKIENNIVTVNFEIQSKTFTFPQITIPVAMSEWVRPSIQVGDKGYVVPASVYMGGISGLGGGQADLALRGNLTASVFVPVSNRDWKMDDPKATLINGPNGVIIRDKESKTIITLTPGKIVISTGGGDVVVNTGGGNVQVNGGDVIADNVSLKTHVHVDGGGKGNSGPPAGGG